MGYRLANLVGSAFCGKFPAVQEAYPGLFEEPDKVQDWRIAKERLMRYAEAHNRRRKEVKEVDGGAATSHHQRQG